MNAMKNTIEIKFWKKMQRQIKHILRKNVTNYNKWGSVGT